MAGWLRPARERLCAEFEGLAVRRGKGSTSACHPARSSSTARDGAFPLQPDANPPRLLLGRFTGGCASVCAGSRWPAVGCGAGGGGGGGDGARRCGWGGARVCNVVRYAPRCSRVWPSGLCCLGRASHAPRTGGRGDGAGRGAPKRRQPCTGAARGARALALLHCGGTSRPARRLADCVAGSTSAFARHRRLKGASGGGRRTTPAGARRSRLGIANGCGKCACRTGTGPAL